MSPANPFDDGGNLPGYSSIATTLAKLSLATDDAYSTFLRLVETRFGIKDFAPWDAAYVRHKFEKELQNLSPLFPRANAENVLRESLRGMGFDEFEASLWIYTDRGPTTTEMGRSGTHLLLTLDEAYEATGSTDDLLGAGVILCKVNLPDDGPHSIRLLLHECGHAVHFTSIQTEFPLLKRGIAPFFVEGIASAFEHTPFDPVWLQAHSSLDAAQALESQLAWAAQELYSFRENLAYALFEHLLFVEDPPQSDLLWPGIAKRMLFPACEIEPSLPDYARRLMAYELSALSTVYRTWICHAVVSHVTEDGAAPWYRPECRESLVGFMKSALDWRDTMRENLGNNIRFDVVGRALGGVLKRGLDEKR